jgi:MFS family permease
MKAVWPSSTCASRAEVFAPLAFARFRIFIVGTTLSNAAQWIGQLTINWLAYDLTGSGATIGTVNMARAASALGAAPVAGVLVDRLGRRRLMAATMLWLCVISGLLAATFLAGRGALWQLYVFALFAGGAQTFDLTLRQAALFELVPRAMAPSALALMWTTWATMRSLGPAFGGYLILWFGPGGNFLVQSLAYALIVLSLAWLPLSANLATRERRGAGKELLEGVRFLLADPRCRTFFVLGWVMPLLVIPIFSTLTPIFAKDVFRGGPETFGLLVSASGAGGILGGLVAARTARMERRAVAQVIALLITGAMFGLFAAAPNFEVAFVALGVAGVFEMMFLSSNQTLLQLAIPDALRGRLTSLATLNLALNPIGAVVAGTAADIFGPRPVALAYAATIALIAVGVLTLSGTIRDHRMSGTTGAMSMP